MITVTVGNSFCHIHGLDERQHKQLRELMSYRVPVQGRINPQDPRSKRHLMTKRGDYPTGLHYIVKNYLKLHRLTYQVRDARAVPKKLQNALIGSYEHDPYPEQLEAANAAIKATRGIIVAPTGTGKSLIIALMVERLKVHTLIVVPSLEIKRQLNASLSEIFGSKNVGPGKMICVANVDSLDPKEEATGYDAVIIDEFHHSGAETYRLLNKHAWTKVYYKFGLTATPFRSQDHEKLLLESVLSNVIYEIRYQDAVAKGYIVPLEAYYIEVPKKNTDGYTWQEVYKDLVVNNEPRNKIIYNLLSSLNAEGRSTLCLVKEIAHGELLYPFRYSYGADQDSKKYIKEFNARHINVLVGTTGVLGEGVDTKPCEYVIIAGLGKSRNAFMQQVGRAFRRYPGKESGKVIIFLDKSHKWTRAHFREQCKILKEEYNIIPVKLY